MHHNVEPKLLTHAYIDDIGPLLFPSTTTTWNTLSRKTCVFASLMYDRSQFVEQIMSSN